MKFSRQYLKTLAFIAVYLFAIYFWSQPYQERKLPYGEYDAMSHFEVADYMSFNDKSFVKLPPYIDLRYGTDNKFKPHTLWYPPPFHAALGIMQAVSGERVIPVFLMNTIMASFILITVYFVVNSLFGFLPAIMSAILIIFSPRDFMPYLWGQWPERFAYAFIPIILYCLYNYLTTYSKEGSKPHYLYLAALFLGIDILIHPLAFFHAAAGVIVLYVFIALKRRKLMLSWKHMALSLIIFLALFMAFPYQTFNVFASLGVQQQRENSQNNFGISRIFQWSLNPRDYAGSVGAFYFSFKEMHGLWTLPFLLLGIAFLAWRREERDLLMLAWLVSLYIILHRDFFGRADFLHRSLSATAHIFAPLTAIGLIYSASLVKIPKYGKYLKYAAVVVFAYFVFTVNIAYASKLLNKGTYDDFFGTLNKQEYKASEWLLYNADASYNVTVLGVPHSDKYVSTTSKKIRWMAAVSQHVTRFYYLLDEDKKADYAKNNYVMMDYTMVIPPEDETLFNSMQEFEKTNLANHTMIYDDKKGIRIYRLKEK